MSKLVLTRRPYEGLTFRVPPSTTDTVFEVEVTRVDHTNVRLAILTDRPEDVKVIRTELLEG